MRTSKFFYFDIIFLNTGNFQHKLHVFASDGYEFETETVDYLIISMAERFDFYIQTGSAAGNYWIRAETLNDANQVKRLTNKKIKMKDAD